MGHGAAKNILLKGYPITVLGHRNRTPVDDLVAGGAKEAASLEELAKASDVVFTCLPSSIEVEATVFGDAGLLPAMRPGMILVDSTTADPNSTRRIGRALAERGCGMVDGPLGRSPREAEEGKLNTFLGGDPATVAKVKPVISCYADTIIEAGPLGSGTTLKLINNCISIGTSAVIAEAVATAARLGLDLHKVYEVVSSGGANSAMFQMVMPWVLEGDDSRLKGPIRIAGKDMRFYCRLAESTGAPAFGTGRQPDVPARYRDRERRAFHADAGRHPGGAWRRENPRPAMTALSEVPGRDVRVASDLCIGQDRLRSFVEVIFAEAGSSVEEARIVSDHLVDANLKGHDSHGAIRATKYVDWVRDGHLLPNQRAALVKDAGALLVIDGGFGYGQVIAREAMNLAAERARQFGLCAVAIRNAGHLGRIGAWPEQLTEAGLASIHFVNTSGFGILVAPYGGSDRRLSANPIAAGGPPPRGGAPIPDNPATTIAAGEDQG